LPVTFESLTQYFGKNLTGNIIDAFLKRFKFGESLNIFDLEDIDDKFIKMVYDFIFDRVFKNYTKKQWKSDVKKIDHKVFNRVPIILDFGTNFFRDKYQGIPENGYVDMFGNMIKKHNIELSLNVEFNKNMIDNFDLIFYTGRIDEFFDYKFGKLEYIKIGLNIEEYKTVWFQDTAVVNYPNNYDFTRVTEFKHFIPNDYSQTFICKEFPSKTRGFDAYPLFNEANMNKYKLYKNEADKFKKVYFVGRLAEFKYLDMDDSIKNVFNLLKGIKL